MGVAQEYETDLTNFGTWVHDFGDRIYRYWVYKRSYTPYEQSEKFSDESIYEDDYASYGYIKEAITLPDGDVLIGFLSPDTKDSDVIEYCKLSEIRLGYYESDNYDSEYDDDEDDDEYMQELFMREWKDEDYQ